jgi:glycosyltransferase involved in cell wall biosynthesis
VDAPPVPGGVSAWAEDLCAALAARGDAALLISRRGVLAPAGARGIGVPGRSWAKWGPTWLSAALALHLRRGDRVICATWPLGAAAAPLCRWAGARLLVAAHGSDLTRLPACPPGLAALDGGCTYIPVSEFLEGELRRLGLRGPARRLPMAVRPGPAASGPPTGGLVCVARPTPLKGLDRAVRLALAVGRPIELIGPRPADLPAALAGAPGVRALGPLPRAAARARVAAAAAAVLLPRADADGTGAEGLGLCLIEAATAGVPAIGCRVGGVPEAVGPGLLLDDPDAPSARDLAAAQALLTDPRAGARARAWAAAAHGPTHTLDVLDELCP